LPNDESTVPSAAIRIRPTSPVVGSKSLSMFAWKLSRSAPSDCTATDGDVRAFPGSSSPGVPSG
jgi:hypothetical protein